MFALHYFLNTSMLLQKIKPRSLFPDNHQFQAKPRFPLWDHFCEGLAHAPNSNCISEKNKTEK